MDATVITAELVRALFDYHPSSGDLVWRINLPYHPDLQGCIAGTVTATGYMQLCINDKSYRAHRIIWLHVHGELPTGEIDHINQVKHDNRLANLRLASRSEQQLNRAKPAHNTSGVKGVSFSRSKRKWIASVNVKGVTYGLYCGYSFNDACSARKEWEVANAIK